MANAFAEFDTRLRKIDRSKARLVNGYTSVVGRDGLIIIKPRRPRRGLPVRGLSFLVVGFFGFKGMLLGYLGPETYVNRVDQLKGGTVVEQAGAWTLKPDPATVWVADQLRPVFH